MAPRRWWWIRHAPVMAPEGTITGQLDLPCDLTAPGIVPLAARLPRGARWIATPLRRTTETAAALRYGLDGIGELGIEPAFLEQHFGAWQGRTHEALDRSGEPAYRAFWDDPAGTAPPGGESFAALADRVTGAIRRIVEESGGDIVIVAHAGTIRAAIGLALDLTPAAMLRLQIDPLSLTRIDHMPASSWRIVCVNERFSEAEQ